MNNLLIEEYPLMVLPKLAVKIGLNEAIILQQIHYWLNKSTNIREGNKWIYNSFPKWNEQFPFWGLNTMKRAFYNLEKQDLLIVGNFNKAGFDKTKWYRINYKKLNKIDDDSMGRPSTQNGSTIEPNWVNAESQNGSTNTRDYTETNTDKKENKKIKRVIRYFQENITPIIKPAEIQQLVLFIGDLSPEVVEYAIDTVKDRAYTFGYLNSVLSEWKSKKVDSVNKAKSLIEARRKSQQNNSSNRKSKRGEIDEELGF